MLKLEIGDGIMLDVINQSLKENKYIDEDVKKGLYELIANFNRHLPDIDLTNLANRLKDLKIKRESMFLLTIPCDYSPSSNTLSINYSKIVDADLNHWMTHSLLKMITSHGNHFGFDNDEGKMIALNEGYTEIITNNLTNDIEENLYTDEMILTNIISNVIGKDLVYDAYFNDGFDKIYSAMKEAEDK